jgi:hypothetical protein
VSSSVWIAVCLAAPLLLAVLGVAVASRIEAARERRRHKRVLEGLGAPVPPAELVGIVARSVVTLEGTLASVDPAGATLPSLVSFHPYGTSFLDEPNVYALSQGARDGIFAVELESGGRALLEGPTQVLAGSVESEHAAPLAKAQLFDAAPLAEAKARTRVGQFRSVRPGDRVRVRGAVDPAPDDDALYRARSKVFRMSPEGSDASGLRGAIVVAAAAPAIRRRVGARGGMTAALATAALATAAMAAFAIVRTSAAPPAERAPVPTARAASSAPACRLHVLADLEKNQPRAAANDAKTCNDPYASALVHYASGEFHDASDAFVAALAGEPELTPSLTEAETHLFAHQPERAANVVHRMAEKFYPGPSTAEKRYLECIGGLLDDRAREAHGGQGPFVEKSPGKRYRKICSTRPFAKLARELDAEGAYWGDDDWMDFSSHTYSAAAAYDVVGNPFTAAVGTRARLAARPVGVERSLLDRLLVPPGPGRPDRDASPYGGRLDLFFGNENDFYPLVSTFAAELTLFYAYAGFPERSAPYWPILDRVAGVLEAVPERSFHQVTTPFAWDKKMVEDERDSLSYVMSVGAAAALLSNDPARVKRYAARGEVHSAHVVTQLESTLLTPGAWEEPAEDGHWADHAALFAAGASGDGEQVTAALLAQHATGRDTLARVLPRIRQNRASLVRWLSNGFPAPCLGCGASDYLGHVSDRREVARLLGVAAESEALRPAAARFTDALTDASIAFELDELETFFGRKH